MMSRRPEPPTHATGAHRVARGAPRAARTGQETLVQGPPARYEPYLDGLFTYCLSVLYEHEAATDALGEVLMIAERRADRGPAADEARRSWLYALARWACLRRLAVPAATDAGTAGTAGTTSPAASSIDERRRAELALLAWPEAAGTTAEQREALELAVRHGLSAHEVAAVLRMEPDAARTLLSSAACEVERTRTALAVVESGRCPVVAGFAGDTRVLLGASLRRELVRHVDDCADCRRTAERAIAGGPWPGTSASTDALPVVRAPRPEAHAAMLRAGGARQQRERGSLPPPNPRFDRRGFPVEPKDRAARRSRLRGRAVTTTVVVTVVAAPVLALWAAYRGAPETGEGYGRPSVSAEEAEGHAQYPPPYGEENGSARTPVGPRAAPGSPLAEVSVAVVGPDGRPVPDVPQTSAPGPGRLTITAQPSGAATLITLTASGGEPVPWSMTTNAPWLRLSRTGGVLWPGQSFTVLAEIDRDTEPRGPWNARVAVAPGGTMVTIEGRGRQSSAP
ncbi:sigma-70 family RNA polymerase sigma factor [Streptomyces sp. UNOC14_S4]|uniref:sigma-70 family RNA polymerase sigma factor n=1 Tax=Streptomyces sp. UNOC14_S4 TaxID=2872340 RepID=UPI001E5B54AF|nr:sigma-70 family RNA polymerase sigma factor [Streptomyces sp. UNOC14_S4]MCC3769885.1 sigma-70 family RNA polymerase sigma factor [Streptomyces sp. UNOC14_S4]